MVGVGDLEFAMEIQSNFSMRVQHLLRRRIISTCVCIKYRRSISRRTVTGARCYVSWRRFSVVASAANSGGGDNRGKERVHIRYT